MYRPTRRNKNIGTAKQGHGRENKLVIPENWKESKRYWEKLTGYVTVKRSINKKEYTFVIERTRKNSCYPCTPDDVEKILRFIPPPDLKGLNLIVFRQPKRKEELLDFVWGRLLYYIEINSHEGPAIMLESIEINKKGKWSKSMGVEQQKEFNRLKTDGHHFIKNKKGYCFFYTIENCRNTQLYRTIPHETGHYVQYLNIIEKPYKKGKDIINLWDEYNRIPSIEKEGFAHTYADKLWNLLKSRNRVPFKRIVDIDKMKKEKINPGDFILL